VHALVAVIGVLSVAAVVVAFFGLIFRLIIRKGPTSKKWGAMMGFSFVLLVLCLVISPNEPQILEQPQHIAPPAPIIAGQSALPEPASEDIYITLDSIDDAFQAVAVETREATAPETPVDTLLISAKIIKVLDAATFDAEVNGEMEKIRLDYVSIPEFRKDKPDQYSKAAMEFSKEQVEGKTVYIERNLENKDKFGRIMTALWLVPPADEKRPTEDEIGSQMLNAILLREGCARIHETDHMSLLVDWDIFENLQAEARKAEKGIWKTEKRVVRREVLLVGNSNSGVLHEPSCSSVNRMKESNKVMLTYSDATQRGYRPCQRCNPRGPSYRADPDEEDFPVYGGKN